MVIEMEAKYVHIELSRYGLGFAGSNDQLALPGLIDISRIK